MTEVEVLFDNGTSWCSLPDLPKGIYGHSQEEFTICGGSSDSCLTLSDIGQWEISHQLILPRYKHTTWSRGNGELILLGGGIVEQDDAVPIDAQKSTEIISPDSFTAMEGFKLKYDTYESCAIPTEDSEVIITGCSDTPSVSVYNMNGWVRDLPSLNFRRKRHACGHYKSENGEEVRSF